MLPPSPPAPPAAPAESVMPPAPMLAPSIEEKPATPPPPPFYSIYVTMCRRRGRPFGNSHAPVWCAGFVREISDEHKIELQAPMHISYTVCLQKKKKLDYKYKILVI